MAAASSATPHRWSAHPWRARGLRLLVYGLPIVVSLVLVHLATSQVTPPTGSLWIFLAWWLAVSLLATVFVSLVYALSRRLLPLGALLELSLVFPDQAPSRFELALRTGTVESLVERLRVMRETQEAPSTQEAAEILLRLVAALSVHDSITRGHAERVRAYSHLLGTQLGLSKDELDRLNWAALLHDVGKLEVSREILNKSGKPTDEEWQLLRLHPEYGEMLVEPLREWLGEWAEAVSHHHERWDGKGYPRGLAGEEISRAGRIVAIADVYDVITSTRSYKEPASTADARAEIVRCAGAQFDERYVRAFVDVSLTRMRLVLGPLSWLTHAPLLARIPHPVGGSDARRARGRSRRDHDRARRSDRHATGGCTTEWRSADRCGGYAGRWGLGSSTGDRAGVWRGPRAAPAHRHARNQTREAAKPRRRTRCGRRSARSKWSLGAAGP